MATNHGIGGQQVQHLLGDVPASDVVPQRALEAVARIDVDGIELRLLLQQAPDGGHSARIAADAVLALVTGPAAGVRGLEPGKSKRGLALEWARGRYS